GSAKVAKYSLCITSRSKFRLKEFRKKCIDLQEPATSKAYRSVVSREEPFAGEPRIHRLKLLPHINGELLVEVLCFDRASLKLKNHLANELLFHCQRQRTVKRQSISVEQRNVFLETVSVLKVDSAEVRER